MATYTALVCLMHDLEQRLASCDRICRWSKLCSCTFQNGIFGPSELGHQSRKEEMEILYNAVSSMDSLLRDSWGQSYDHELMDQTLEKRILDLACEAGNYLDFWAVRCLQGPEFTRLRTIKECLTEITQEIDSITDELRRLPHNIEAQDLKVNSSTGTSSFTHIRKAVGKLKQHLDKYTVHSDYRIYHFAGVEITALSHAVSLNLKTLMPLSHSHNFITQISEKRILEVAYKAGSFIDFVFNTLRRSEQCLPRATVSSEFIIPTMTNIIAPIVSINEKLRKKKKKKKKKIGRKRKVQDSQITSPTGMFSTFLSPSRRILNTEGKLVGLDKDLITMLDSLTGHPSRLNVLSIIGMAGIGKTTFARKIYDDPLVLDHFDVRVWVTVSQRYQVREILLGVLCCVTNASAEIYGRSDDELREQAYKILKGRKYLIVLDDMWCIRVWDELKRTFPDDKNGSRIMLTSRLRDVATHASQETPPHSLNFLSKHESWELLSSKILVDESYPQELVEIGKRIAYKCQGLPLALVVVGGLLSKMNKKLDLWEEVAQSVGPRVMEEPEGCQDILALSYNYLPDHLKACFLYIGIFPEDYEISVKKLIWLWIAEGFIRPTTPKSLEQVADGYLEDLISRNLILVKRSSSDGRIKTCYIHDVMRELCLKESRKQNFLHVVDECVQLSPNTKCDGFLLCCGMIKVPQNFHKLRRLSFHSNIRKYFHKASLLCTHSVMCFEKLYLSQPLSYFGMDFKLLKVLDFMNIRLRKIPTDISDLTLLKFLALSIEDSLDIMCLCTFLSLQTLILDCEWVGHLPRIFWDMLELRHFHLKKSCLSSSPSELKLVDAELPLRVLNNLRSVSTIRPMSCTKKVFLSMPHLKKLGIYETEEDYHFRGWFENLVHLRELESLKYVFCNPFFSSVFKPERLPSCESFPPMLVKLTMSGTCLPWDDMLNLSMLPKLEVLKLRNYAFSGAVWQSMEGGFRCLKFLLVGSTDLEIWEADGTDHFPSLQHLVLRHCRSLQEIPYGISEAPLLENIELHCCKDSAEVSARHIQEEQQSLGNDLLRIRITEG